MLFHWRLTKVIVVRREHTTVKGAYAKTTAMATKMSLKKWTRAALYRAHSISFTSTIILFARLYQSLKFRKRKRKSLSWACVHVLPKHEIWQFHVLRAATANKSTKKRDARAKLLFCQSKPITLLPFSFPSPSSLLKLPLISIKSSCDMILSTDLKLRKGTLSKGLFNTCT